MTNELRIPLKVDIGGGNDIKVGVDTAITAAINQHYQGDYTVTPTEEEQGLSTAGLIMDDDVTVEGIDPGYVGSGVTRRDSDDLTATGPTVTAPAGYYEQAASKSVQSGSVSVPDSTMTAAPSIDVSSSGLITATTFATKTIAPSVTAGYVTTGTSGTVTATGTTMTQLTTQAASMITPTESQQVAVAEGTYTTGDVNVDAIPSTYIGSNVPRKSSADLTAAGATVSAPAGYYAEEATKTIAAGSATTPATSITANPSVSIDGNGLITATVSASQSVTPTISAGYVTTGTAGTVSVSGSGTQQLTKRTSSDLTSSGATVTAPAGYYPSNASATVTTMTLPTTVSSGHSGTKAADINYSVGSGSKYLNIPEGYNSSKQYYQLAQVPQGTEGTPTATKGTVSSHQVAVTPSVTNSAGYISGGTHSGTAVTVSASELVSGTKSITANDTGIDVTNYAAVDVAVPAGSPTLETVTKSYTPTESAISDTITPSLGYDGIDEVDVSVGAISPTYVGSGITQRTSSDLTASGATVTAPSGYYASNASATVSSGSATAPATISGSSASVSTGTNTLTLSKTISVTPTVTAGYVSTGTAGNSSVSLTASVTTKAAATYYPGTTNQTIASGTYLTGTQTINALSQTNLVAGNIKNGTTISISNGQSNIWSVTGTYDGGGGGSVQTDTKTTTASNYPTSLSFTSMKGEPKMFTVRLNASVSSSGNTTYYYIVDITSHGTTTHGNCFRIGSTRQVTSITSGYSWSYSGTTLTITSSAGSRSASPGAFYSGSYELLYVY